METIQPVHINDLANDLLNILLPITAFEQKDIRDTLLHNWPVGTSVVSINRSNNPLADLSYIISAIASWGRLTTGEWALAVLAKKAQTIVKGTDPGRKLEAWLTQLDQVSPDDHYREPPLGAWSKMLPRVVRQWWPIWLITIAGLGFIMPVLWPTAIVLNEITRYIAAGLVITLLLTIVGIRLDLIIMPFNWWMRSLEISIYGPAMGFVQGVVNSFLWLGSFYFVYTDLEQMCLRERSLGAASLTDYFILLIASLILSFVVAVVIFLILPTFGRLASALNQMRIRGILGGYLLLTGVLLLLAIILPYGWSGGAIGLMEVPQFCPLVP